MKFNSFKQGLAFLFAVLLLSGCESLSTTEDDAMVTAEPVAEDTAAADTSGAPDEPQIDAAELAAQQAEEAAMKEQAALREVRTFYFDFDQAVVKAESRAALSAHAAFLAANPATKVVLEGHTDERGTKEYNIALGESRAKSIASFLRVNGVSDGQFEVISFGEERPAELGQSESAWAQNRRVYIEYK